MLLVSQITVILSPAWLLFSGGQCCRCYDNSQRKRSEPRDPNAPKRPGSAYIYFSNEMRPKLKEEKPELGMAERSKHIGKTWATLEAEKKKVRWLAHGTCLSLLC